MTTTKHPIPNLQETPLRAAVNMPLAVRPLLQADTQPLIQALLRSTDYGILMTDRNGTDIICNPQFGSLFDIDPEIVVNLPREEVRRLALERVASPDDFLALMNRIEREPLLENTDEICILSTPTRILRRYTAPVRDANGSLLGRVWTFQDVTEMRKLQAEVQNHATRLEEKVMEQSLELQAAHEKLLQTAQTQAVGILAVGIAHDLRNILTTLRLEMEALESGCRETLQVQLDRIHTLTLRLLSLAEEESFHPGVVNIEEVLQEVIRLVQSQAEIDGTQILLKSQANLPPVYGSGRRLEHLLVNLLLNGIHAVAAKGGTVEVAIQRCNTQPDAMVCIAVKDNGPGIPSEDLPHLFEAFFTKRANRSGLGLFSAKKIVETHNGQIRVASEPGNGTTVTIWLPMAQETTGESDGR